MSFQSWFGTEQFGALGTMDEFAALRPSLRSLSPDIREKLTACALIGFLNILDVITTYLVLSGPLRYRHKEGNALSAFVLSHGWWFLLLLKVGFVLLAGLAGVFYERKKKSKDLKVLWAIVGAYAMVVFSNTVALFS